MPIAIRETPAPFPSPAQEPASSAAATSSDPSTAPGTQQSVSQPWFREPWFRKPWIRQPWLITCLTLACILMLLAIGVGMQRRVHTASFHVSPAPRPEALNENLPRVAASAIALPDALPQSRKAVEKTADSLPASGPMIARSVSLTILIRDFQKSRTALDSILTQHHGYPAQLTISTPENASRSLQASLRIPAAELAAALSDLRALGSVQNESQSGEEVSQQHADLVARLINARDSEERLRAILQQRTGKIEDVLQVQEEISRVRGEIEGMEAEQKALEHRVDFASVDLQFTEQYTAQLNPQTDSIRTRLHNAFVAGYDNASGFLLALVLFFAEYGPILLILVMILGVPAFFLRRRYRKTQART